MKHGYITKLEKLVINQCIEIIDLKARIAALEHENTLLSLEGGEEEEDVSNRISLAVVDPR